MYEKLSILHAECFPDRPWSERDFAELAKSGCEIIASENSFIVWRAAADEAEIITLGVRPALRRTGTASALLALMEKEAAKSGAAKIFLEVAADNAAATALYEKNGYAKIGIRPKYYDGVDAVMMGKNLTTTPSVRFARIHPFAGEGVDAKQAG